MALSLSEQLLSPISANNGVGQWLRYDPIYVKIRDARREENDGMHREAWEGELKRADWQAVEKMAYETTEKQSKDLQLVTWLIEARLHLYGLDVFSQDTAFLLAFIKNFWENCHPQKTEDPNQEFRTHILEAFIRSATETILLEPFAELSPILNQSLNLAKCYENDNLEKMSKQGGSAASSYQKALADGLVTISRIKNAFSEVDKEKGITKVSQLEVCVKNLQTINLFLDQEIGTEGPNFDSLINHLQELKNLYSLCQKVVTQKLTNNLEPEITTLKEPAQEKQEEADSNKKTINNRTEVYQAIRELSGFLLTLDPHSPSPALLQLIGGWENKTLPQILAELQSTQPETKSLLELLARATQQEKHTANTTPKSTDISALSNLAQG
jgi:type VI secretion system protein ImpA